MKPDSCPIYSSLQQVQGTWVGASFPLWKPLGAGDFQRGCREAIHTPGGFIVLRWGLGNVRNHIQYIYCFQRTRTKESISFGRREYAECGMIRRAWDRQSDETLHEGTATRLSFPWETQTGARWAGTMAFPHPCPAHWGQYLLFAEARRSFLFQLPNRESLQPCQ